MNDLIRFTKRSRIDAPVEDLFRWHTRPGAVSRLSPPWNPMKVIESSGRLDDGAMVVMEMKAGPVRYNWTAKHTDYVENRMFQDIQVKGPFSTWRHTHRFTPDGIHAAYLEDIIDFKFPLPKITHPVFRKWILKKLDRIFTYRHHTTALDLGDHLPNRAKSPMNILISGAGGTIGSALMPYLTTGGHRIIRLVRKKPVRENNEVYWNPYTGDINTEDIGPVDAVIHLSGDNIGSGSWTPEKKQAIIHSRIKTTQLITRTLLNLTPLPKVLICASAIGYYGHHDDRCFVEDDPPGNDFISTVCTRWESCTAPVAEKGVRVVSLRIGVVLTPSGGALSRLLIPHYFGMGLKKIGTGNQIISWVGMDDVLGAVLYILNQDEISGPVNLVAPEPVTNLAFNRTLARVLNRPASISVPMAVIRLFFGQMGKEVLLSSTCVVPKKLLDAGYRFRYPNLEGDLRHLLGRNHPNPPETK